jgi:hypothetical protein
MPSTVRLLLGCAALLFLSAHPAGAQGYPFSQRALVAQNVAFTEITISYGRPVARGRTLFPDLVKWDREWNPGADSATRLTISHTVEIEGRTVPAGDYSLWLIPRESGPWTVILSRAAHVMHTPYPGADADQLRVEVAPEQGAHMETLAYYFPVVLRDEAVLRMHWGTTVIPLRVRAPFTP